MFTRYSIEQVKIAMSDTPVVFVMGPRQVGKTTLVQSLIEEEKSDGWEFISLDDETQYDVVQADRIGFIRNLPDKRIALDEVQRIPELFRAIKQSVDENRKPGRYLMTGSANPLLLPRLSDSLAGRIAFIRLKTLSECEIRNEKPAFLSKLLNQEYLSSRDIRIREHLLRRLIVGCFPEPVLRNDTERSAVWYQDYVETQVYRDIRDLTHIDHPEQLANLLEITAFYAGKLVDLTELAGIIEMNRTTVKKYISLLEQLFLIQRLPAWHSSEYKRLIKMPKLYPVDTGLMCALRGLNKERLLNQPNIFGLAVETFVFNELQKQAAWIKDRLKFYHYRDKDKVEVDFIIEDGAGDCFAIEVKSGATLTSKDFVGLKRLNEIAGDRFKLGVILYDGDRTSAFGDRLFTVPLGALWSN